MFWFLIYNIFFVPVFWLYFRIISVFNAKVRAGIAGRQKTFTLLKNLPPGYFKSKRTILIHSSSLGEYQQAIPIIEQLNKYNINIIVSFFSPSGYENARLVSDSILKIYLPFDSCRLIKKFLNLINPSIIFFVRYDLWFNLIYLSKKKKIKTIIANARFDERKIYWKLPFLKSFARYLYGLFDKLYVIDEEDRNNFIKALKGYKTEIIKVGDSKFERVYQASENIRISDDIISSHIYKNKKVFVVGSSWKDDEEIIFPVLDKIAEYERNLLTILVPHEPKETKIVLIEKNIKTKYKNLKSIRYSDIDKYKNENIIIVDSVGKLLSLYSVADISYVGGGLRTGLHNILEPAVFGMPVYFANDVTNSDEDKLLIEKGVGFTVKNQKQFYKEFRKILSDEHMRSQIAEKCKEIFKDSLGATEKIISTLKQMEYIN